MPGGAPDGDAQAMVERLRGYVAEMRRPPTSVGVHAVLVLGRELEMALQAQVAGWRALGVTHLSVDTMRIGHSRPQEHVDTLRQMKHGLMGKERRRPLRSCA